MTEKAGGVFLLQEHEPRRLLASLSSLVTDAPLGTIRIAFHPDAGFFESASAKGAASLVLAPDVALSLAGLLHVLVAQSRFLRGGESQAGARCPSSLPRAFVIRREPGRRGRWVCTWSMPTEGIESIRVSEAGDQLELRFREDIASGMADAIVDALGRFSAWPPE